MADWLCSGLYRHVDWCNPEDCDLRTHRLRSCLSFLSYLCYDTIRQFTALLCVTHLTDNSSCRSCPQSVDYICSAASLTHFCDTNHSAVEIGCESEMENVQCERKKTALAYDPSSLTSDTVFRSRCSKPIASSTNHLCATFAPLFVILSFMATLMN